MIYDINSDSVNRVLLNNAGNNKLNMAASVEEIGKNCNIVFSMLPNDQIVEDISLRLLNSVANSNSVINSSNPFIHISCSTISPMTARKLELLYDSKVVSASSVGTCSSNNSIMYISAPVFAGPDGIQRKEAIWLISGHQSACEIATQLLQTSGKVEQCGDDVGAGNVMKLCGNFLIAVSMICYKCIMLMTQLHIECESCIYL